MSPEPYTGPRRTVRDRVKTDKRAFARYLRNHATESEKTLWQSLRRSATGVEFRRQSVLYGWIADFYAPKARLVVEVDGGYHLDPQQKRRDALRDRVLKGHGVKTLRISADRVFDDLPGVLGEIESAVNRVNNRVNRPRQAPHPVINPVNGADLPW